MRISPAVGCSRPAIARSVVVLPQPDGPSSVNCSPGMTLKLTPRTAGTLAVIQFEPSTSICGAVGDAGGGACMTAVPVLSRRGCAPTRRVTATSTIMASATTSVWISAKVGGEFRTGGEPGFDDRRRDHLGMRAHQQDGGAELAHAGDEQQQPGGDQPGPEQRDGHGAHAEPP